MKKYLSILLVASAIHIAGMAPISAAPLSEKIKAVQSKPAKLNINTANLTELESLPGIGAKKAQAIINYRNKVGKFASVNDLSSVKGIGEKMVVKLQKVAMVK